MPVKQSCSWILKAILSQRTTLLNIQNREQMKSKVVMRKTYDYLRKEYPIVDWKVTMYRNVARPRAIFTFWMACHGRLPTKNRLCKFGVTTDGKCCFCSQAESLNHLFFGCPSMKVVWYRVLRWMNFDHVPLEWDEEL
ncbi:hypothetical protein QL285_034829 [Trifolium repens]|nr:hypothetical protein QL285_034829 [Trifolium repens]